MYRKKREDNYSKPQKIKYNSWFRKQIREHPLFGTPDKEIAEKWEVKEYLYNEFNGRDNIEKLWQLVQLRRYVIQEKSEESNGFVYYLKYTNLMVKDYISGWTYRLLKRVPKAIEIIGERLKIFHDSYEIMSEYIFSNLDNYLITQDGEVYRKYNLVVIEGKIKIGLTRQNETTDVTEDNIVYKNIEELRSAKKEI